MTATAKEQVAQLTAVLEGVGLNPDGSRIQPEDLWEITWKRLAGPGTGTWITADEVAWGDGLAPTFFKLAGRTVLVAAPGEMLHARILLPAQPATETVGVAADPDIVETRDPSLDGDIEIRFSPEESRAIEVLAERAGQTLSQWVAETVEAEITRREAHPRMNIYRVVHHDGSRETVYAEMLVEYDDGTYSLRVGDQTVALGNRAGGAAVSKVA